jgi:hypothetical protein
MSSILLIVILAVTVACVLYYTCSIPNPPGFLKNLFLYFNKNWPSNCSGSGPQTPSPSPSPSPAPPASTYCANAANQHKYADPGTAGAAAPKADASNSQDCCVQCFDKPDCKFANWYKGSCFHYGTEWNENAAPYHNENCKSATGVNCTESGLDSPCNDDWTMYSMGRTTNTPDKWKSYKDVYGTNC